MAYTGYQKTAEVKTMSSLSQRVQKSKSLKFNLVNPLIFPVDNLVMYGTTSHNHTHHYQITLKKLRETSPFGDKEMAHDTIRIICIKCHQPVSDCPGNSNSTVCYHGLGAVRYHLAQKNATVSFCQTIFDAVKLRKPGQSLVKIVSGQGGAILWGVVERKIEDRLAANVQVMRLSPEEAEGID